MDQTSLLLSAYNNNNFFNQSLNLTHDVLGVGGQDISAIPITQPNPTQMAHLVSHTNIVSASDISTNMDPHQQPRHDRPSNLDESNFNFEVGDESRIITQEKHEAYSLPTRSTLGDVKQTQAQMHSIKQS